MELSLKRKEDVEAEIGLAVRGKAWNDSFF